MRRLALSLMLVTAPVVFTAGCAKKKVAATTPSAPVAAAPAATPEPRREAPARAAESTPAAEPTKPRFPNAETRAKLNELLASIRDAYFDYDRHDLRPDAQAALQENAKSITAILRDYPDYKLTIEGHADERGSAEYNLALGEARAQKAREFLVNIGLPGDQLRTVSYGKERQQCTEQTEECWQKNRRAHVVALEN
jgi:peptidoglycan-associated lipoprotein